MSKNKFSLLILILTVILFMICPFAFAEDEEALNTDDEYAIQLINEVPAGSEEETDVISEDEIDAEASKVFDDEDESTSTDIKMETNDVYLIGDNVKIDYIVDGNLYVIANTVEIDTQIVGNAFICADKINITTQGYISCSLYAVANTINIDGVVYDIYSTSQDITLSGYVYRDINSVAKNITILGTVCRNANLSTSNLSFKQNTENDSEGDNSINESSLIKINGNLNYSAPSEIEIPEGIVDGEVKYEQQIVNNNDYLGSAITFVVLTIVVWLLLKWLAPKFIEKSENLLKSKPLPVAGFGLLGLIAIPIVALALILLNVTSKIGLLILAIYFILICLSTSIFVISISNVICSKLKIDKWLKKFGLLIAVAIVAWLLTIIPYAGIAINLIYTVLGLGIIVRIILPKREKVK